MSLLVEVLPALEDNYNFVLRDSESSEATVVDPSGFQPTAEFLDSHQLKLTKILLTHHHWDHVDGVEDLRKHYGCKVLGSTYDRHRLPDLDQTLEEGNSVWVGPHKAKVLHLPGHTLGHIAYWWPEEKVILLGDVLFSMGCGRLFEGSPEMMWQSLQRLMALPDETKIYCAHEYTLTNAQFALEVDPHNPDLRTRVQECQQLRQQNKPTIPTTLGLEKTTNPFLRAGNGERFAELRRKRDQF